MAATGGFIQLHRKIVEWEWYKNTNTFRVFLHCLLMANFTDGRFEGVEVKRGQFVSSLPNLAKQTLLSIQQVRTALDHLKSTGEITDKAYAKFRVITVVKYDMYQQDNRQNNSQSTGYQQASNRQSTGNQQQYNNNNNNNKGIMEKGNNNISCLFDQFWSAYPRKEAKAKAKTAFEKIKPDEELLLKMIDAVEKQKKTDQWTRDGGQYIPHPATWLNQRRWEDEIPVNAPVQQRQQKVLPAQDFEQRDYTNVQKEIEERQRQRIIEAICRNNGLWDEANNKPVDGWREKMDQLKAEGRAV